MSLITSLLKKDSEVSNKQTQSFMPGWILNQPLAGSNTVKGDIGIEIEIEGRYLPNTGTLDGVRAKDSKATWAVTEDGSLRSGLEYKLSKPCNIDELEEMLIGFYQRAETNGTQFTLSNRCSTHVHLNMTGLKVNEVLSTIVVASLFEKALIAWWGEKRKTNHFCLSIEDCDTLVGALEALFKEGNRPSSRGLKYNATNILTLWSFGSLEFRYGDASTSYEKPLVWALFLHYLKQYCIANFQNPYEISYALSERGGESIFRDICGLFPQGEQFVTQVLDSFKEIDTFDASCIESFRTLQSFVMEPDWPSLLKEINKEFVPNPFEKKASKKFFREIPQPDRPRNMWVTAPPEQHIATARAFNELRNRLLTEQEEQD